MILRETIDLAIVSLAGKVDSVLTPHLGTRSRGLARYANMQSATAKQGR